MSLITSDSSIQFKLSLINLFPFTVVGIESRDVIRLSTPLGTAYESLVAIQLAIAVVIDTQTMTIADRHARESQLRSRLCRLDKLRPR